MSPDTLRRLTSWSQIAIAVCLLVIVGMEYVRPLVADLYYRDRYRALASECDHAMHEEAALRAGSVGAQKHPSLVLSAQVGLMVCHEYDKLRKRMLILGVSEEQLALHGLQALESEQIPVSRLVEPHQMDRF